MLGSRQNILIVEIKSLFLISSDRKRAYWCELEWRACSKSHTSLAGSLNKALVHMSDLCVSFSTLLVAVCTQKSTDEIFARTFGERFTVLEAWDSKSSSNAGKWLRFEHPVKI